MPRIEPRATASRSGASRTEPKWEELIDVYLRRAEVADDSAEAADLLREVAHVYENELNDPARAYEALLLAFLEDPSNDEIATEIERMATSTNNWNHLLQTANEALQTIEDRDARLAICRHCAHWYAKVLGHPEYALPYDRHILSVQPDHVGSIERLAEFYRSTERYYELAQTLNKLADVSPDAEQKADAYVQMGELCEKELDAAANASGYYRLALRTDPKNRTALDALEWIYRRQNRQPELLAVLERKSEIASPSEEIDLRIQMDEVERGRPHSTDSLVFRYREVLDDDPHNTAALRKLGSLYERERRWEELLRVLEAQVEEAPTVREKVDVLRRIAALWEEQFERKDHAAQNLERLIGFDPRDAAACRELVRLYGELERPEEVLRVCEHRATHAAERSDRAQAEKELARAWRVWLDDPRQAVEAYRRAVQLEPNDIESLGELAEVYEELGLAREAVATIEKAIALKPEREQLVHLLTFAGRLWHLGLGRPDVAIETLEAALAIEPNDPAIFERLAAIHDERQDWPAEAKMLERWLEREPPGQSRSELLVRLGRLYVDRLDDSARGAELFAEAHAIDPENRSAPFELLEDYIANERVEEAYPLARRLFQSGLDGRPAEQRHRIAQIFGRLSLRYGQNLDAVEAFEKARTFAAWELDTLVGLADAHYGAENWAEAFKLHQLLVIKHAADLGEARITELHYRIGMIHMRQNDIGRALRVFDRALHRAPDHKPTLEAVADALIRRKRYDHAVEMKQRLVELATDDEERADLWIEISDLWAECNDQLERSVEALMEAVRLRSSDRTLLHRLLARCQEAGMWPQAIGAVERLAELDEDPGRKARYLYTIGIALRDELDRPDDAIARFESALDWDPKLLKAFEAINRICTQRRDWPKLERAFRKMIHRLVGKNERELEFSLWHNLGIIYRDRMKRLPDAAVAFEMASRLDPANEAEHQIVAEVAAMTPGRFETAVREHQWLIAQDPKRVDSYHALFDLYARASKWDAAYCLADALVFFGAADEREQKFIQARRPKAPPIPKRWVDDEAWLEHLQHPEQDVYLGKMLAAIGATLHAGRAQPDKELHLTKRYAVDLAEPDSRFGRVFARTAGALHVGRHLRLFVRPDLEGGLSFVPESNPPATVCGSTLIDGYSDHELAFAIARHVTYYRPEHFPLTLLGDYPQVKGTILAALRIAGAPVQEPEAVALAAQIAPQLHIAQREILDRAFRRWLARGARTDVKRWLQRVEMTACRAGLLCSGDLRVVAKMLARLPPSFSVDQKPKEKLRELVLYAISDEYFALRAHLGLAIEG